MVERAEDKNIGPAEDKNIEPDQELELDVEGHSIEFNVGCCV